MSKSLVIGYDSKGIPSVVHAGGISDSRKVYQDTNSSSLFVSIELWERVGGLRKSKDVEFIKPKPKARKTTKKTK